MFWLKLCKSNWISAWNLAFFLFLSYLLYGIYICENLHFQKINYYYLSWAIKTFSREILNERMMVSIEMDTQRVAEKICLNQFFDLNWEGSIKDKSSKFIRRRLSVTPAPNHPLKLFITCHKFWLIYTNFVGSNSFLARLGLKVLRQSKLVYLLTSKWQNMTSRLLRSFIRKF